jgi:hypothetical protein
MSALAGAGQALPGASCLGGPEQGGVARRWPLDAVCSWTHARSAPSTVVPPGSADEQRAGLQGERASGPSCSVPTTSTDRRTLGNKVFAVFLLGGILPSTRAGASPAGPRPTIRGGFVGRDGYRGIGSCQTSSLLGVLSTVAWADAPSGMDLVRRAQQPAPGDGSAAPGDPHRWFRHRTEAPSCRRFAVSDVHVGVAAHRFSTLDVSVQSGRRVDRAGRVTGSVAPTSAHRTGVPGPRRRPPECHWKWVPKQLARSGRAALLAHWLGCCGVSGVVIACVMMGRHAANRTPTRVLGHRQGCSTRFRPIGR